MIRGNISQRLKGLLLVLLVSFTSGMEDESLPSNFDFEDLPNETSWRDTDSHYISQSEELYDYSSNMLQWVDDFTNRRSCDEFWSCANTESNSSKASNGLCYCDDLCSAFGDCCEDKMVIGLSQGTHSRFGLSGEEFPKMSERKLTPVDKLGSTPELKSTTRLDKHLYSCTFNHYYGDFFYTISACPKQYANTEIKLQCEQPTKTDRFLQVPVSGFLPGFQESALGVKFKNVYCALCHGVSEYQFWQPKFDCYSSDRSPNDTKELLNEHQHKNHTIEFIENKLKCRGISFVKPPKSNLRSCFPINDACQASEDEETILSCRQGPFHPVFLPNYSNKIYRNIYCVYCDGQQSQMVSCNGTEYVHPSFSIYDVGKGGLSKLYNFNIYKQSCGRYEIYDFYQSVCRAIVADNSRECEENDLNGHDPSAACPTCQLIKLDESEYRTSGDESVYFHKSDLTINKSLLHFISNKPYICAENYNPNKLSQWEFQFDRIEIYLTIIGLTLSILALLLTFGVYTCFRSLRNVPGKMSMNLVAAMFFASLLFIFSNDKLDPIICTAVAVFMHYAYLGSFFWMNALSFDAWSTFSKTAVGGRNKNSYKQYLIYCWVSPLFIVLAGIFVQFSPFDIFPSWLSPNYGPPLCWISNKWALLIFFAAPLFILILSNVVFYTLTIRAIYRTEKFSDRLLSKKNKGMFLIYLKLCFIMGINWVFALLHTFTGVTIIRYISVFLNSFQGFWVGCSYLFSKQVWRQLKEQFTLMFRTIERHHSDLSGSKQTSGTYVSSQKSSSRTEKYKGKA